MYVLFIYTFFFGLTIYKIRDVKLNLYIKFTIIIFLIALFLRFNMGADIDNYIYFFDRVSSPIKDSFIYPGQRNVGFNALMYFSKIIVNDFRFFQLILNFIVISLCSYTVSKESDNTLLSLCLFIGSGVMEVYYSSGLRQMQSMTIFFFAYFRFLQNKYYFKYYLFAIIACLFHEAALVTLIIPIFSVFEEKISRNEKVLILGIILSALFSVLFSPVIMFLTEVIPNFTVFTHVLRYMSSNSFSLIGLLLRIVIFVFVYSMYKISKIDDRFVRIQIYTCYFSFIFYICLCQFSLSARVSDFVDIITIITIPNLIIHIKSNLLQKFYLLFLFLLNFVLLYTDINFKLPSIVGNQHNPKYSTNYTLGDYEYVNVFNQNVDEYIDNVYYWIETTK